MQVAPPDKRPSLPWRNLFRQGPGRCDSSDFRVSSPDNLGLHYAARWQEHRGILGCALRVSDPFPWDWPPPPLPSAFPGRPRGSSSCTRLKFGNCRLLGALLPMQPVTG